MAILGKIRDLGPAALISVIGLALFAFVFSTGSGSITDIFDEPNQSPVGSINGEKISIEEFRNQVDFLERSYNLTGMTAVNNVWDQTLRTLILKNQFELSGIGSGKDHIENILVPTENVLEMRDGKKKIKEKVFFPGYLLIHIEMNKETKYVVENVNGVISFVGSSGKPEALKPDEVKRFLGDHDGADGPIVITEAAPFKVGDSVNVKDEGVIIRSPFDKHSSLDIAFNPSSAKALSETFIP